MKEAASIDVYIGQFPKPTQVMLRQLRALIKKAAPKAEEAIKYGMPTFVLNGNLVHFAAYARHIGLYPTPSAIKAFAKELLKYKTSKGAVQFSIDKPLPLTLIKRIVMFRVKESLAQAKKKKD